ncbi:EexN family lipoprotein [Steroidobacter sp. S1-65]|uniref:EexN family lipoprotein n=1 Tax=Steroidobacter gossypii TaxID=2805490 RepID=A0ABS1WXT8_9GAMM|nr:EexN family lipoprotein [Steroidobacter gossypii]MBM0105800.1 EexN family lipoprotein [Steroidobacter gossypii]
MKLTVLASIIAGIAIGATGCSHEPKKAQYTVEQYLADRDLMNKKVEECANNPGELRNDPDCINARAAASKDSWGSLRDRPPVGLNSPASTEGPSSQE